MPVCGSTHLHSQSSSVPVFVSTHTCPAIVHVPEWSLHSSYVHTAAIPDAVCVNGGGQRHRYESSTFSSSSTHVCSAASHTIAFAGSAHSLVSGIVGTGVGGAFVGGASVSGIAVGGASVGGAFVGGAFVGGAFVGGASVGGAFVGGAFVGGAFVGGAFVGGASVSGTAVGGAAVAGMHPIGLSFHMHMLSALHVSESPCFMHSLSWQRAGFVVVSQSHRGSSVHVVSSNG